ncbi:OLC1v1031263C1 [Oldenlandia corymbosa var. corymbosa]|uniref:RING-type E3 ubiquitin transferase n=1 Tax=Oldenlandia corymbosa var. corymbosa TaxID=529605 RepID=A0AAV1CJV4_OLDCO|nr:OLC1v1031263C1 [Oldenlandia corymbosa var. corymbosa]
MSSQNIQHPDPTHEAHAAPPITVVITIIILLFFFVGFFSLYFCRCFLQNLLYSWHLRHSPPGGTPVVPAGPQTPTGIDPKIIQSFPTFTYSSVKDYRKEKYGLECAICLVEFSDDDVLRFLTACCHVFHQECIDLWLEKHKTCPVCRRSLDTTPESPEKSPISFNHAMQLINGEDDHHSSHHSFCISIKDEENDQFNGSAGRERTTSVTGADHRQIQRIKGLDTKFSRSHSTGHSIIRRDNERGEEEEAEDRFTLRLPDHVHAKIIRGHNWSRSCTTFGEFNCKEKKGNGGFGEVSGLASTAEMHEQRESRG